MRLHLLPSLVLPAHRTFLADFFAAFRTTFLAGLLAGFLAALFTTFFFIFLTAFFFVAIKEPPKSESVNMHTT